MLTSSPSIPHASMDIFDVAVIGAGPAGSMAAKYAAKTGAKTILLEEHAAAGWPVQCAGLLGGQAMAESELPQGSHILRGMLGASVFSPGGQRLDFKAKSCKAWVVDRRLFDQALLGRAVQEERSCGFVRLCEKSDGKKGQASLPWARAKRSMQR